MKMSTVGYSSTATLPTAWIFFVLYFFVQWSKYFSLEMSLIQRTKLLYTLYLIVYECVSLNQC